MRHILFFLCLTSVVVGQRDTLNESSLRTYAEIDTTADGYLRTITTTYKTGNVYQSSIDTIDTRNDTLLNYTDSLITIMQSDSVLYHNQTEMYFDQYKERNSVFENVKRYLAKLWAIRPD